jgi:hypothetical protein
MTMVFTNRWVSFCFRLFTIPGAVLFLASCSSCNDKPKPKPAPPVAVRQVESVKFFIDNSESNMGYLSGTTSYKEIVGGLITECGDKKSRKGVAFHYLSDKLTPIPASAQEFISTISNNQVPKSLCSEMHTMLSAMTAQLDSFDVGVLVSDCILSFCDMKGNKNRNIDNAPSELKLTVNNEFRKLRDKGISAVVYAYKSDFTGRYFDCMNAPKALSREVRPFYVWLIGRKAQLHLLDSALQYNKQLQPLKRLDFGMGNMTVNAFDIMFRSGRSGNWKAENGADKGLKAIEFEKNKPIQFTIALNLGDLPAYAQDINYLRQHLKINNTYLKVVSIKEKKDFTFEGNVPNEKKMGDDDTHFIMLSADNFPQNSIAVQITLERVTDNWYAQWSTNDDRSPALMKEKTFALEHLINGVKDAYDAPGQHYVDIKINLKKD